jgi:hypothetical protein
VIIFAMILPNCAIFNRNPNTKMIVTINMYLCIYIYIYIYIIYIYISKHPDKDIRFLMFSCKCSLNWPSRFEGPSQNTQGVGDRKSIPKWWFQAPEMVERPSRDTVADVFCCCGQDEKTTLLYIYIIIYNITYICIISLVTARINCV